MSGIKVSSLIHSFDNAWSSGDGDDLSHNKKTQHQQSLLQALPQHQEIDSSDDECYMEDEEDVTAMFQDRSIDYSLDSDINTSLPDAAAPMENLLDDSSFPDMAEDDDDSEIYLSHPQEEEEEEYDNNNTGHQELEAIRVQGSDHSDDEATNMTGQLSMLLSDNTVQGLNLSTAVEQETSATELPVEEVKILEQETTSLEQEVSAVQEEVETSDRESNALKVDAST